MMQQGEKKKSKVTAIRRGHVDSGYDKMGASLIAQVWIVAETIYTWDVDVDVDVLT